MPTASEIRARARESLSGNWTHAVVHFLLYFVIISTCGWVGESSFIGWIALFVVTGAFTFGINNFYLTLSRGELPQTADLFKGFNRFVDTFLLYLLCLIFTFLWALLFIVPGIIAAFRYSQAYYILRDNPEISALEAINRSKAMMVGHKGRLFYLMLTYIGWYILGLIPLGIGLLWVAPYFYTALGHFHNDLLSRSASVPLPTPPNPYKEAAF